MAVMSTPLDSVLVVSYQVGLNEQGAPIVRKRSFDDVVVSALDQDLHDVATALYALTEYPLVSVRRDNRFDLEVA